MLVRYSIFKVFLEGLKNDMIKIKNKNINKIGALRMNSDIYCLVDVC